MKESKILKLISYIALTVLISLLILSIFIISAKGKPYYDEEKYFKTENFAQTYISYLYEPVYHLIHYNDSFYGIKDGEIEIHYSDDFENSYLDMKNRFFLIIYQDIALTNVELTNTTNTIQGIKQYIENNVNAKNVNIIKGEINSESDIIQTYGIQYLDNLTENYYTYELNESGNAYKQYKVATAKDLEIYSSYVEEFKENTETAVINNLIEKF